MVRILFTGGASGGHIYPIVALTRTLGQIAQKERLSLDLFFAGSKDFDTRVLDAEGITVYHVPAGKMRRYASFQIPLDFLKACLGFFYAFFLLWWLMPDVIFAKGGYGSFAVAFWGRLFLIPIFVHESDSRPGLANRIIGKFASRVGVAFPSALSAFSARKSALVGNPTRLEIGKGSTLQAKELLDVKGGRPVILILGGSQGATRINSLVAQALKELLARYEVIHQCGQANVNAFVRDLKETYDIDSSNEPFYHLKGFLNEREEASALAVASFVISRAGAGSIYDIALAAKPALLIPLPEAAADHQRHNAFYYARLGGASVIEQDNLTPHLLINEISTILSNPKRIETMQEAARKFFKADANERIARELLALASS